jgi:hypothetical protein
MLSDLLEDFLKNLQNTEPGRFVPYNQKFSKNCFDEESYRTVYNWTHKNRNRLQGVDPSEREEISRQGQSIKTVLKELVAGGHCQEIITDDLSELIEKYDEYFPVDQERIGT